MISLVASGQKSAVYATRLFRVRPATVSRALAQHRAEQLGKAPAPKPKPPVRKKKSVAIKTSSRKLSTRMKAETAADTPLDAIGLARLVNFKDFPGALSVLAEAKTWSIMARMEWQAISPRTFMSIWEAENHIQAFRQDHVEAPWRCVTR